MNFLPQQWLYRCALLGSSILAIWLGFFLFSPEVAVSVVRFGGYWLMAITFGLFVVASFKFFLSYSRPDSEEGIDWIRWAIIAAVSLIMQIHEPHGFKIIMDELVLGATSMSMHFDREIFCPIQVNSVDGMNLVTGGIIDKRPYFFAFILSVLHDLTGYRPENAFILNAGIGFLLLGAVGELAERITNRSGGRLAVLLLAGLPLLAINVTGGGFELLNLFMIAVTMLGAISFLEREDAVSLNFLVLSGILLAQTRYESVLFVGAVGIVVGLVWWRKRSIQLTLPLLLAPLLLVPYPLLNSIFRNYKGFWQLPANVESPFGLEFLPKNLAHSVAYFFDWSTVQTNSVLLSSLGIGGFVFFALFLLRRSVRLHALAAPHLVLSIFGLVIFANYLILMCYHWGRMDEFVVSRLGLPLMLLMALIVPFVLVQFKPSRKIWNCFLGLASGFLIFVTIPASSRAHPTNSHLAYRETAWFLDFIRSHRDEGAYFVIPSSLPAVVLGQPGASISHFRGRAREIDYHLRRGTYSRVYVMQRMSEDLSTGELTETEKSRLGESFELELLDERKFGIHYRSRISLLASVEPPPDIDGEDDVLREIRRAVIWDLGADGEEGAGVEEFIKMLP